MRVRGVLAIAGVALLLACGSDTHEGDGAAGSQASGLHGGQAGRSADAGKSSTGAGVAGKGGSAAPRAGSPGVAGGAGGADTGAGGSDTGAAGAEAVDNSCTTDADCVLCNAALPPGCCGSCPTVRSQTQCDADQRAFKQRCASNTSLIPVPMCPAILCVDPGQPACEQGMCIRVAQAER
jgi:hypothetical protein